MSTPPTAVPEPHRDELFDEPVDEPAPESFDRDFWVHYLRDLHGFDGDTLETRTDSWVWSRALEVLE